MNSICIDEGEQRMRNVSYLQVSHLSCVWKGEPKSAGWLRCFHEPEVKNHLFSLEERGVFFLFPPCSLIFCRLSFQLGTVICSEYLNNVGVGGEDGSEGVSALLDVKLYFNAGFCVGS